MKLHLTAATAALLVCALATSVEAQSGVAFEAGAAQLYDVTGAELGVGYRFAIGPVRFTPTVGGFIYQGENDRYYFDDSADRCRDRTNGQFARTVLCDATAVSAYGRLEATARFRGVEFGVGYRVDEEDGIAYGTASFDVSERMAIKANAGEEYVGLALVFR
ncbi:MAG: hypothetical protein K2X07_10785 [Caulobacteraceae bacterium]|nr:hypothetical protein [Caulobacteraceae bacterium]